MRSRIALATATILTATLLTGCSSEDRWCEADGTNEVVDNTYCEDGTLGYEWEPDTDAPKSKPVVNAPKTRSSSSSKSSTGTKSTSTRSGSTTKRSTTTVKRR